MALQWPFGPAYLSLNLLANDSVIFISNREPHYSPDKAKLSTRLTASERLLIASYEYLSLHAG